MAKSKIMIVSYGKRFNLGNYEHEEIQITGAVDEDSDAISAIAEMKEIVHAAQSGDQSAVAKVEVKDSPAVEEEAAPVKATRKSKKSAPPVVEEEEEEQQQEETEDYEIEGEEEEEEAPAKPAKKFKSKATAYNRKDDMHKTIVGKMLTKAFPDWKKKLLKNAQEASKKMEGKDFLDNEGNVLATFEKEFKKMMR